MKKGSIRLRLAIGMIIIMSLMALLSFLLVFYIGGQALRGTSRDFLIDAVEKNVAMIRFLPEMDDGDDNIYIAYHQGFLEIDTDFLQAMGEVYAGLYSPEGSLLYGENPLAKQSQTEDFLESKLWQIQADGASYMVYDRKINCGDGEVLWIRGVVSESEILGQMNRMMSASLYILPLLIIFGALIISALASRFLQPLQSMEETVRHISQSGVLKERVRVPDRGDEITSLAGSFNSMLNQLEESFERERRFTSDASHELRTPVTVMLAQTEYTLEAERSPEAYREALQVVQHQGRRMKRLIGDMLDYSRMDLSAERYPLTLLDLSELVQETAQTLESLGDEEARYEIHVEENIRIMGNEDLLVRLVMNLVSNAFRYSEAPARVTVGLRRRGQEALLWVEDHGIGIPEEEQEKIFERFYRSDNSRSAEGTGLGLSLVKKISEIHNGKIELESAVGEGSCFTIHFPLV